MIARDVLIIGDPVERDPIAASWIHHGAVGTICPSSSRLSRNAPCCFIHSFSSAVMVARKSARGGIYLHR